MGEKEKMKKVITKKEALKRYKNTLLVLENKPNKTLNNLKRIENIRFLIENLR